MSLSNFISSRNFFIASSLFIIAITTGIYYQSLSNPLTHWDDDSYVTNNPDIRTLHGDSIAYSIKDAFSSYEMGNYHPLTILSYSIEYSLFGLNDKVFHTTNLLLHIANSLLVFLFVWLLCKQPLTAFITALLFAIHPMRVESVAWVAERKDVLYSFFYLGALCTYCLSKKEASKNLKWLVITILLFIMACLSKGMAVSFPLALVAIDYFTDKSISKKSLLNKIPFFVVALIFGIVAIKAQNSVAAFYELHSYNFIDRILFSSYGILLYLWKLILPLNLSNYYNYPLKVDGVYPIIYHLSPLVIAAIAYGIYKSLKWNKTIVFGFAFFIITIVLVLQILPVGGTIISERYSYLPYLGIFFIIAYGINYLLFTKNQKHNKLKIPATALLVAACCFYSFKAYHRTTVWNGSIVLWTNAIDKDDSSPLPFKSRASAYYRNKEYIKAIEDLNQALMLNSKYADALDLRGQCLKELGRNQEAISDFTKAIEINPTLVNAYLNRGVSYYNLGKHQDALNDCNTAIKLKPNLYNAYNNRGNALYQMGNYVAAIKDYSFVIQNSPFFVFAYNGRGMCYLALKNYQLAMVDFNQAISLDAVYAPAYYGRGNTHFDMGKPKLAIADYNKALELKPNFAMALYNRAGTLSTIGLFKQAYEDALKAQALGVAIPANFIAYLQANIK